MSGSTPKASAESAPSPEALALEARAGSSTAFEGLVARFEAPLYRFLYLRTRDEGLAQDLTQEAFLRAWQNLERYDPRWRFSTWLFTVAERLCISQRRSRGKGPGESGLEPELAAAAPVQDPGEAAAEKDEGRALWETAVRVLRPEERSALWLRYAEDRSMEEIGAVLGRPPVTVRVILFRARGRLAQALEGRPTGEAHRFTAKSLGGLG